MSIRPFLLALLVSLTLFSCNARQDLRLDLGNSADLTLNLTLSDFFVRYLQDLGAGAGDAPVFDTVAISQAMEDLGVEVRLIRTPEVGRLEIQMHVSDPEALARDRLALPGFISWRRGSSTATSTTATPPTTTSELRITLNQEIIRKVIGTTSLVREEGFEFLLPLPGGEVLEYRDDLVWIFEEYAPGASLEPALEQAKIEIDIFTPQDILLLQGPGLVRRDSRRATLTLGVLDALTFAGSRTYLVRY